MRREADGGTGAAGFDAFVLSSREPLLRAFVAHHGADAAPDLLADSYAHAWSRWRRVARMENPVGYVYRVGERLGQRRAQRSRRETSCAEMRAGARDPFPAADDRIDMTALLRSLPARQRTALLLVHGHGHTYAEAARLLDVPVTTITNDINRGLVALRRVLVDQGAPR